MTELTQASPTRASRLRPPLVKGIPLVGNLLPLLKDPHQFLQKAYSTYGEVFRFKAAHQEYVILAGQEANRFVAGKGKALLGVDNFWGEAQKFMGCPNGLVGIDGEIHQYQRKVMQPLLSQSAFKDRLPELAAPINDILDLHSDASMDFCPLARQMISNQIGFNLQGYKTSYQKVEKMIYYFGAVMNVYGMRKWPKAMLYTPKFKWAEAIAKKNSRQTIVRADARTEKQKSDNPQYLDALLPALRAKPEWFSQGDLEMHALLPFIAALDTVASTMGFMLYQLLENAMLYRRIQQEVDEVFLDKAGKPMIPELKQLRAMTDLQGLVKETLRLHPTAFGITRNALESFEFQGYRINKGENVIVFTTADHTNSEFFPEPKKFDIDRNNTERNEFKQTVFAPFGKGPHNCLGASLAEIILPLNMGLIFSRFDIKTDCDLNRVKVIFNPAPALSNNFRVVFSARN